MTLKYRMDRKYTICGRCIINGKNRILYKYGKTIYIKYQKNFVTLKSYKKQIGGIGCNVTNTLSQPYSTFKDLVENSKQIDNNGTITYGYLMFCIRNRIQPESFCIIDETVYQMINRHNNIIRLLDELIDLGFAPSGLSDVWHSTTLPPNTPIDNI